MYKKVKYFSTNMVLIPSNKSLRNIKDWHFLIWYIITHRKVLSSGSMNGYLVAITLTTKDILTKDRSNKYETEMHHLPHQALRRATMLPQSTLLPKRKTWGQSHVSLSFLERLDDIYCKSQHTESGIYSCQLTVSCLLSWRLLQDLLVWGWTKPRHFAEAKGLWDVNLMKTQS